jgi:hypothetical protein
MIRSGRIRSAFLTSARWVISPRPSILAGRVSRRVLDRHDALVGRNEAREDVQQRGLAAAGAARDQDVELGAHHGVEQLGHLVGQRAQADQVLDLQRVHREPANREQRAVDGRGRDDGVDARAVRQARVDHRARFVDAATHARHHLVDHAQQVGVVEEGHVGQLELAAPLHVDVARGVDEDVGDGGVGQQRLKRPVAEHLVLDVRDQAAPLRLVHRMVAFLDDPLHQLRQLAPDLFGRHVLEAAEFHTIDQCLVDLQRQLLVGGRHRARAGRAAGGVATAVDTMDGGAVGARHALGQGFAGLAEELFSQ